MRIYTVRCDASASNATSGSAVLAGIDYQGIIEECIRREAPLSGIKEKQCALKSLDEKCIIRFFIFMWKKKYETLLSTIKANLSTFESRDCVPQTLQRCILIDADRTMKNNIMRRT